MRKCYGAGLYAMSGPAFGPEATIALPTAKIAVMGPEAAVNAVYANRIAAITDPEERAAFIARERAIYEEDVDLLRLASELVFDAIVDFVGGSALERHQKCLAEKGRLVLVGLLGGAIAPVDLGRLLMKRQRLCGLVMRSRSLAEKVELVQRFERRLWPGLKSGQLSPTVDRVFPLADVSAAHAAMERNENTGKLVLRVS